MKKMLMVLILLACLGCATTKTEPPPLDQAPVAQVEKKKGSGEKVGKAFDVLLSIGRDILFLSWW